jgi:hypothetical protein
MRLDDIVRRNMSREREIVEVVGIRVSMTELLAIRQFYQSYLNSIQDTQSAPGFPLEGIRYTPEDVARLNVTYALRTAHQDKKIQKENVQAWMNAIPELREVPELREIVEGTSEGQGS